MSALALLTLEGLATAASMAYSVAYFTYYAGKKAYSWNQKTPEQIQDEKMRHLQERVELLETKLRIQNDNAESESDSEFIQIE